MSPRATIIEAPDPRACAPQQENHLQWEFHALQLDGSPYWPRLEKAHMQQRRPRAAKNN